MFVLGVVNLKFNFDKDNHIFTQQVYVIRNFTPGIVLGTDFLKHYKVIIDYNVNKLECHRKHYRIMTDIYTQPHNYYCNITLMPSFNDKEIAHQAKSLLTPNSIQTESGNSKIIFNVAETLNQNQQVDMLNLLNEFRDIFSAEGDIPAGNAKVEPAKIHLEDDIPVARSPYRTAQKERELIEDHVTKMTAAGVIRESQSPYSAPVVLVKKSNKDPRFCVDYRLLNKKVTNYSFPMPRTDDFLNHLNGAKYFTSIDLKNCFWQIPLAEEDRYKTAFATNNALHEYNVLPFGLKSSPAICQKAMNDAVKGLLWNTVLVYMDDWLIPSPSWEHHLVSLRKVFQRLRDVNLKVKPEKCCFGSDTVKVLGHMVSKEGVAPDENKLRSVKLFPRPKNVKQTRSFLGLANYYRMFIPKFSQLTKNLQDLTKKNSRFQWTPEHEGEFQNIKEKLLTAPVLRHFDPNLETELVIDASDYGIGAILQQKEPHEKSGRVVSYASRNLRGPEMRYFTTEKEMMALVFGTTVFRNFLWGKKFTVITDHASLRYWNNIKNPSSRLMRFVLRLSEFDFNVIHTPGKLNTAADALSRTPIDNPSYNAEEENIPCYTIKMENLGELQRQDPELDAVIKAFNDTNANRNIRRKVRRYILQDGALFKKIYHNNQDYKVPVIPRTLRAEILNSLHDSPLTGAHLGRDKCMAKLKTRYFWENMYSDIEEYVRSCPDCQLMKKGSNQHAKGLLQPIEAPTQPFEHICIDIVGPFIKSVDKKRYIITCVDFATRYAEAKAVPTATAEEVATFLYEIVTRHGAFRKVSCDRGAQFRSKIIENFVNQIGAFRSFSTAYHPASQGVVERFHASLANMLAAYTSSDQKDWPWSLPSVLFAYNTSVNKSTKFSPFELVYGRQATLPLDVATSEPESETQDNRLNKIKEWRERANNNIREAQSVFKKYFDKKRTDVKFKVGDKVMLHIPARKVGRTDKLEAKYHGPLNIKRVLSDVNYEVEGKLSNRKNYCDTVHIERLKPYYEDQWGSR